MDVDTLEGLSDYGGLSDIVCQIAVALQLPAASPSALQLLRSINARVSEQLLALAPALFSPLISPEHFSASQARIPAEKS